MIPHSLLLHAQVHQDTSRGAGGKSEEVEGKKGNIVIGDGGDYNCVRCTIQNVAEWGVVLTCV